MVTPMEIYSVKPMREFKRMPTLAPTLTFNRCSALMAEPIVHPIDKCAILTLGEATERRCLGSRAAIIDLFHRQKIDNECLDHMESDSVEWVICYVTVQSFADVARFYDVVTYTPTAQELHDYDELLVNL